jgi:hypothetical protein
MRTYWYCEAVDYPHKPDEADVDYNERNKRMPVPEPDANLVSSRLFEPDDGDWPTEEMHWPVLDIDKPQGGRDALTRLICEKCPELREAEWSWIRSTTPGNGHLFIDGVAIGWVRYMTLLHHLEQRGWLEKGFVDASLARGATFVRKPGHRKVMEEVA